MSRFHWVAIVSVDSMPEQYLIDLIAWPYQKTFGVLSGKNRNTIESNAA